MRGKRKEVRERESEGRERKSAKGVRGKKKEVRERSEGVEKGGGRGELLCRAR